jgi:aminopeptidase N
MSTEMNVYRIEDYAKTQYLVPSTALCINIFESVTKVSTKMKIIQNKDHTACELSDLVLNGNKDIDLHGLKINGVAVPYDVIHKQSDERDIIIDKYIVNKLLESSSLRQQCLIVELESTICPETNTELSGMYKSNSVYCTQCEPYGFRKITYSIDRPDVLSIYTVTIIANKRSCPVMLSNGNMVSYELDPEKSDRHRITWSDPHPKPSYLFAVVAGDLGHIEGFFTTKDQKHVTIRIYSPHDKVNQLSHAMKSVKMAMQWDEERYGLSYDLETFNVVCLDDFNMGAMENKGLNIFNSKYVLANPMTATDTDYELITDVIGHEYFHNWTGNRVTVEKWFDLTLKEGLTVYRDQEFTLDTSVSRIQYLIQNTSDIRNGQFIEDQGPNAHPIRPQSYVIMDNFYTSTVYDKGAEIVRIYETLLGRQGFRKGMDLYFQRHDGSAVACENFWRAMYDANINLVPSINLPMERIFNWYNQPGTPRLEIEYEYRKDSKEFVVRTKQSNPMCLKKNGSYNPVLLPIRMGLLSKKGTMLSPTNVQIMNDECSFILPCCESVQEFVLHGIDSGSDSDSIPVPSFMRDFSAPCITEYQMSFEDRLFLMRTDPNQWNRWEQSQILGKQVIEFMYNNSDNQTDTLKKLAQAMAEEEELIFKRQKCENIVDLYVDNMVSILSDPLIDPMLKSCILTLPCQDELVMQIPKCDPVRLFEDVIQKIYSMIAEKSLHYAETTTLSLMKLLESVPYEINQEQVSARSFLKTLMVLRLSYCGPDQVGSMQLSDYAKIILDHYQGANNLTSQISCIRSLSYMCKNIEILSNCYQILDEILNNMANNCRGDSLMTAKWLAQCASIHSPNTVKTLTELYTGSHSKSSMISKNTPNHLYSLIQRFSSNPYFHQLMVENDSENAPGYEFLTNCILDIDSKNSIVASSLATVFEIVDSLPDRNKKCMKECIHRIMSKPDLSASTREILSTLI